MAGVPFLLTIAELAPLLRRDVSTVHEMIRNGEYPFDGHTIEILPINGRRQVRRADVEAFLGAAITAVDLGLVAVAS